MELINKRPDILLRSKDGLPQTENLEFVDHNGVIYIKFDGLPYDIRTFAQENPLYDQNKMVELISSQRCGNAYYYPEQDFYILIEGY